MLEALEKSLDFSQGQWGVILDSLVRAYPEESGIWKG